MMYAIPIVLYLSSLFLLLTFYAFVLLFFVFLQNAVILISYVLFVYKNVTVFPSRSVAIENALRVFSPQLAIVDEHLTRNLPKQWLTSLKIEV